MNGARTVRFLTVLILFALTLMVTPKTSSTRATMTSGAAARTSRIAPSVPQNVTYHGGPVMAGIMNVYAIFWEPPKSIVDPHYNSLITQYYNDVGGSSLYQIMHQYTQQGGGAPTSAVLAGAWVDTINAYPGKILSSTDILAEVNRAMAANNWVAGPSNYFPVYTGKNIQSDDAGACAYHSSDSSSGIIYGHIVYPTTGCKVPTTPNGCKDCDSAISTSAHEQFEAATDPLDPPLAEAWYYSNDTTGEIADLCEPPWYKKDRYGTLLYDNGQANQMWNGHYYIIQEMWDNTSNGSSQTGGCSQGTIGWPEFGFDPQNTRFNRTENILSPSNVSSLGEKWSFATGGGIDVTSASVANGMIYIDSGNSFYALNAITGSQVWSFGVGSVIQSTPAAANGVVYVGSNNLYALNASTGSQLWSFGAGAIESSPAVSNGIIYLASAGGTVYALNASTGSQLWSFATGSGIYSSPAVFNNVVYIGSKSGNLYALNASTGAELWSFATGSAIQTAPSVANGVVYVSSANSLYALSARTGSQLWHFAPGGNSNIQTSPAVANGVVYVGLGIAVYALNARTGGKFWSFSPDSSGFYSSPAVANGVVYIGSYDQNIYALNASTGAQLWSFGTGGLVDTSPVVTNGMVYVRSTNGTLFAFGL